MCIRDSAYEALRFGKYKYLAKQVYLTGLYNRRDTNGSSGGVTG